MATGYILNMFGKYEEKDGDIGITLFYAGLPFWLPYGKVTAIPDWSLREVDHDRSTPPAGEMGELMYRTENVTGKRVVAELCDKQNPVKHRDMGILPIEGKATGQIITVMAGANEDGSPHLVEVQEREATRAETAKAEALALAYKKLVIAEYFQSKRERMTGSKGKITPDVIVRQYMEELNVEDIDDVSRNQRQQPMSIDPAMIAAVVAEVLKEKTEITQETIRETIKAMQKITKPKTAADHPDEVDLIGRASRT